eukprot:3932545-Rhodomonas_salina.1
MLSRRARPTTVKCSQSTEQLSISTFSHSYSRSSPKEMAKAKSKSASASSKKCVTKKKENNIVRCSEGITRHNMHELSEEAAIALYKRDQVLWLRLPVPDHKKCASFGIDALQKLHKQCPKLFSSHWSVENPGKHSKDDLTAEQVRDVTAPNCIFCDVIQGDMV